MEDESHRPRPPSHRLPVRPTCPAELPKPPALRNDISNGPLSATMTGLLCDGRTVLKGVFQPYELHRLGSFTHHHDQPSLERSVVVEKPKGENAAGMLINPAYQESPHPSPYSMILPRLRNSAVIVRVVIMMQRRLSMLSSR